MTDMEQKTLIDKEKAAWKEVLKRLDFMTELVCAQTDKTLVRDSSNKFNEVLGKLKPLFRQRLQTELKS
jgi:hypothetical protein